MVDTLVRILGPDDEPAFRTFLAPRASSSMFLLSNSSAAGFVDEGKKLQATYVGAFVDGQLVGVAAHCWNGMLLVQVPAELTAPETVGELVRRAVAASGRAISGFSGPADQVQVARRAFTLPPATLDEVEGLYTLDLADLRIPGVLASRAVTCRPPRSEELPLVAEWRRAYHVETLGSRDSPELGERCLRDIEQLAMHSRLWVIEVNGISDANAASGANAASDANGNSDANEAPVRLVAMTAFNAQLPELVQVGGVYTPPELRGRGYARCVVAGSLLDARADGATRAILFTKSPAAARAYEALGFTRIGDYALVLQ